MPKTFAVYQTINLTHYIEADDADAAKALLMAQRPLDPPEDFTTDIDAVEITGISEIDDEEV